MLNKMNFKQLFFIFGFFILSFNFIYSYDSDLGKTDVLVFDEIKIYNFALNDSQVKELYLGQFRSIELESSVTNFDSGTGALDFDVTFFFIEKSADLSCNFYYSSK